MGLAVKQRLTKTNIMAGRKKVKTQKEIAEEYIRRFPKTPNLTLARKIYKENSVQFRDVDGARQAIRIVKGSKGKYARNRAVKDLIEDRSHLKNPFDIPESHEEEWTPFVINHNLFKNGGIINDVHFPYHDRVAVHAALERMQKEGIDFLLINGDLLDFYPLSRFDKDPRNAKFWEELEMGRDFFAMLQREFPKTKVFYKLGNHEERFEKYMMVKAPELLNVQDFKLDILLKLAEYGVEYIDEQRIVKYMGLDIVHGHEFMGNPSQAVNSARGLFNKTFDNAMTGHFHKSSEHTEKRLDGSIVTTWSVGCLCGLTPKYARLNRWNHGFAFIENEDDSFRVTNLRIHNGKIY